MLAVLGIIRDDTVINEESAHLAIGYEECKFSLLIERQKMFVGYRYFFQEAELVVYFSWLHLL